MAAGVAIEAIARNVPLWDPPPPPPQDANAITDSGFDDAVDFSFDKFDIVPLIKDGRAMLGSSGAEYELDYGKVTDPKERIALQKKRLKENLELGEGSSFVKVDFLSEADIKVETSTKSSAPAQAPLSQQMLEKGKRGIDDDDPAFAGLSAREKQAKKRRMKMDQKNQKSKGSAVKALDLSTSSTSAVKKRKSVSDGITPTAAKKIKEEDDAIPEVVAPSGAVVVEHKVKEEIGVTLGVFSSGDEWPFEGLCEQLCLDLFDPAWEMRHGAAVGLSAIMKVHGSGCGRIVGLTRDANQRRHDRWLEDAAIRILCVLALDRFADFVGDHVVVPVRETCAQTLSVLMKSCNKNICVRVIEKGLIKLIEGSAGAPANNGKALAKKNGGRENRWEVRHAGLIGLKYWMAVRQDLVGDVLVGTGSGHSDIPGTPTFHAILEGLKDADDDVRSVSSSTLLPISDKLLTLFEPNVIFRNVVTSLWNCLEELDDLTAATASVMDLLSKLVMKREIVDIMRREPSSSLKAQVPRLFPFFRHAITSVRLAVLRTVATLLDVALNDTNEYLTAPWVSIELIRLLFQNFIVEQREDVVNLSAGVWTKLCRYLAGRTDRGALLANLAVEYLPKFFSVVMTPIGISPIDVTQFYNHGRGDGGSNVSIHDKAMVEQDLNVVSEDDVLRGRLAGCTALGKLMGSIMTLEGDHAVAAQASINSLATGYIKSGWANHRVFVNTAIEEWAVWHEEMRGTDAPLAAAYPLAATLCEMLVTSLSTESGAMLLYNEILAALRRVKEACDILIKYFKDFGAVGCPALPPLYDDPPAPPLPDGSTPPPNSFGPVFTLQVADRFLKEVASQLMTRVLPGLSAKPTAANPNPPDRITFLNDRQRRVEIAMETFKTEQSRWNVCTVASAAKAVVQMGMLPPKLNPVVRALMDSVKFEASFLLQKRAVSGIGRLIEITLRTGKVGANDKVLKNLGVWLCADADWGDVASVPDAEVILSLKLAEKDRALAEREKEVAKAASAAATEDKKGKPGRKKSTTVPAGSAGVGGDTEFSALDATGMVSEMMKAQRAHVIVQRGADYAIGDICRRFGANVFMKVPKLWDMITVGVTEFSVEELSSSGKLDPAAERCKNEPAFAQTVVDALLTFKTVGPSIDTSLHPQLCGLLRPICRILRTPLAIVRHAASHAIASIAAVCTVQTMQALVENVIPLLGDSSSRVNRQGAAECVSMVVAGMEEAALLPYIVFMIVPMLGRMSDPDEGVRFVSTSVFAHLVKLVPLESGVPDPVGMDPEMVKMKAEERKFMAQLVGKTVDSFEVPKGIKADLRPYQKDGVSWLAFLNRYGLHGILCDDMGLGKTLQSICILASDHYLRAEKFAKTGSPDSAHTPSLVVCPPTLTGHWQSEILEYAGEVLRPMIYVGGPAERARHRSNISKNDVIITSYDILRNDIDELGHLDWNYCILDEGHVIKNAKTKLTKAVKSVRCMKRLILSGTPIQNNVLELWSLFDFLMPGFLGTEQQFNVRFGKPILASRDAKSSSSEQEKGALALEALHKQVLPFLMRRMKEDVLHDLPPKIIQDYYVDLSDLQKRLYEDFGKTQGSAMAKADLGTAVEGKKDAKGKGKAGTGTHVFQALQYLRKLCNHPSLVLTPKHPQYEKISKQMAADGDSIDDIKHAPKIAALRQILLDCGIGADPDATNMGVTAPHRALIFVQLREMLDHIENGLFQSHMPSVTYMRMDGGTETSLRHEMVTRFNADPSIDVFLLTTSVGGLGLNLTGADTVIFVEHDWNPMKDLQAMDRAHRIGQKRVVNVYRLIMRGTLEEKIMGLQKFKMNIASSIINADNAGIESMDTDQILDLFSVGGDQGRSVKPVAVDEGEKKVGMKEVLENLGGLWDEKQYDSLEINDFLANLK
ncbi:btaf1 RNA polymerase II, B-TFIID transcription factor-associated, 170kDa [Irineochytrium annulatum]|nr:btaf1 RNA polymerase II, B-TFIID transcription factor-associated, 170kDa [Irineochytrium annulatum]